MFNLPKKKNFSMVGLNIIYEIYISIYFLFIIYISKYNYFLFKLLIDIWNNFYYQFIIQEVYSHSRPWKKHGQAVALFLSD